MAARVREVIWAESARDALDAVITYIAQDSQQTAVQVLEAALHAESSAVVAQDVVRAPGSSSVASGPMRGSDGSARAAGTTESSRTGNRRPGTADRFSPSTDGRALAAGRMPTCRLHPERWSAAASNSKASSPKVPR